MSERVIHMPVAGLPRLDEKQMRAALAVPDENPLLRAVRQVIEDAMAEAVLDASDPLLEPGKGTHPGGRVAALAEVRARLEELRRQPEAVGLRGY